MASQPEFADPAGPEFVLFVLGVVFEDHNLEGMAGDRSGDPGARGVQLAAFGSRDLQAVAQVVVRVHLCVLCVGETNRSTTTQLPRDRERHPLMFRKFEMDSETVFLPRMRATGSDVRNAEVRCCSGHADFCRLPRRSSNLRERWCHMDRLKDYLKTAEAAEFLGVSENTLRTWAANGVIPMHRNPANGYRLFKQSDLAVFLKKTAQPVKPKA